MGSPVCGCLIVILFVGTSALEDDVAGESILDGESELALVEDVLLWSEVDQDLLGQVLLLKLILWHRWLE